MVDFTTTGYPIVIFSWILFALTSLLVFARLYVQLRYRLRPWREIFLVVAWVLYLGYTVCDSLFNDGDGYNYSIDWDNAPDSISELALKANYAWLFMYLPSIYACKAVLLCFYYDLAPRHIFPKTWWAITITWIPLFAGTLIRPLSLLLACKPISAQWHWSMLAKCTNGNERSWTIATFFLHLLTDLIVYLIPIGIVFNVGLNRKEKIQALAMFGLGLLNIFSAIELAVQQLFVSMDDVIVDWEIMQNFIRPFQISSVIIIACLPYCRKLWILLRSRRYAVQREAQIEAGTQAGVQWRSPPRQSAVGDLEVAGGALEKEDELKVKIESQND